MTTALANAQGLLNPLSTVSPDEVLERYLRGETTPQIAESFGVTRQAISFWLIKTNEEVWKSVQLVKAIELKDRAEELLRSADNALDLARGRELLKASQWDLERVCRRIYGQDQAPGMSKDQLSELLLLVSTKMLAERQVNALPARNVTDI